MLHKSHIQSGQGQEYSTSMKLFLLLYQPKRQTPYYSWNELAEQDNFTLNFIFTSIILLYPLFNQNVIRRLRPKLLP